MQSLGHFCLCSNKLIARTLIFCLGGRGICDCDCFVLFSAHSFFRCSVSYMPELILNGAMWETRIQWRNPRGGYRHCGKCSSIPTCLCIVGTLAILMFSVFFSSYSRLIRSARSTSSTFDMPVEIRSFFLFRYGRGEPLSFFISVFLSTEKRRRYIFFDRRCCWLCLGITYWIVFHSRFYRQPLIISASKIYQQRCCEYHSIRCTNY